MVYYRDIINTLLATRNGHYTVLNNNNTKKK
jgi:hypothetical protein